MKCSGSKNKKALYLNKGLFVLIIGALVFTNIVGTGLIFYLQVITLVFIIYLSSICVFIAKSCLNTPSIRLLILIFNYLVFFLFLAKNVLKENELGNSVSFILLLLFIPFIELYILKQRIVLNTPLLKTNFYCEEEMFRTIIELRCINPLRTAGFLYPIKNKPDKLKYLISNFNELPVKSKEKHISKKKKDDKYRFLSSSLVGGKGVSKIHEVSIGTDEVENTSFELMRSRLLKRIFDIFFSILVCVFVLSWLYPVIFIFIKIESQGPVIFKQHREGLHGRPFICYKFRSMYSNSFTDNRSADSNDEKITKVGAFLRRNSLDELPQFLNVLYGSMSVVGPRPHLKKLAQEYQKEVGNYTHRHDVKPGITGLAQVSGYRGKIRKKADIKNRIRLDIFYIKKRSLVLDISIIIKTIYNLFKGDENAC